MTTDYAAVPNLTDGDTVSADNLDSWFGNFKAVFESGVAAGELVKLDATGKFLESAGKFGKVGVFYGSQSLASGADIAIGFDEDILDPNGWHDPSSNPDRITIKAGGIFLLILNYRMEIDPTATAKAAYVYVTYSGVGTVYGGATDGNAIEGAYYRFNPYNDMMGCVITGGISDGYIVVKGANEYANAKTVDITATLIQLA